MRVSPCFFCFFRNAWMQTVHWPCFNCPMLSSKKNGEQCYHLSSIRFKNGMDALTGHSIVNHYLPTLSWVTVEMVTMYSHSMSSLQESLLFSLVDQMFAVQVLLLSCHQIDLTDVNSWLVQGCDIIRTPFNLRGQPRKTQRQKSIAWNDDQTLRSWLKNRFKRPKRRKELCITLFCSLFAKLFSRFTVEYFNLCAPYFINAFYTLDVNPCTD